MAKNIHEFRIKLLDQILHAYSGMAVVHLIDTALEVLAEKKVHGHIVIRFIDKMIFDMEAMEPGSYDDSQRISRVSKGDCTPCSSQNRT
ncbi:MAG: hypothetical protein ABI675_18530 [Chitinophagaceae bacterium]